jgi:hypothetical protein
MIWSPPYGSVWNIFRDVRYGADYIFELAGVEQKSEFSLLVLKARHVMVGLTGR